MCFDRGITPNPQELFLGRIEENAMNTTTTAAAAAQTSTSTAAPLSARGILINRLAKRAAFSSDPEREAARIVSRIEFCELGATRLDPRDRDSVRRSFLLAYGQESFLARKVQKEARARAKASRNGGAHPKEG
jgi:hypothetical protein